MSPSSHIMARLLHRDAMMLVIDKPAGLPVHPDRKGGETVADWLDDLRFGLPRRPEAAHRLDRDTSGCLILGRHRRALARLGDLFRTGATGKSYWALVEGRPPADEGSVECPLGRLSRHPADWRQRVDPGGQAATTRWRVLARSADGAGATWMELSPLTGRTHQLRVHMAAMGWPIVGDHVYGNAEKRGEPGLMLHARSVSVPFHPKQPPVVVMAPAPAHMAGRLAALAPPDAGSL